MAFNRNPFMPDDDPFDLGDNPFGGGHANPFMPGRQAQNPFLPPQQRSPGLQPVTPEEEETVLGRLGSSALGGLGYIGATLDKALGGRAIRGALAGKPREVASIIPFSDTLGITNPEDTVYGKELLGFDKNDDSWGAFGAGLGAELLLDPATYLTFGGKTLIGQAAQKAGALAKGTAPAAGVARGGLRPAWQQIKSLIYPGQKSAYASDWAAQMAGASAKSPEALKIAEKMGTGGEFLPGAVSQVANKPQSALATFRVPFTSSNFLELGTGEAAQNIANKLAGAGDSLLYSKLGRSISPLFDARVSEYGPPPTTETGQRATRAAADRFKKVEEDLMGQFFGERGVGEQLGMADPARYEAANRELTNILEAPWHAQLYPSKIPEFNAPGAQELIADYRKELIQRRAIDAKQAGRKADYWTSAHGMTPRGAPQIGDVPLRPDEVMQYGMRSLSPKTEQAYESAVGAGRKWAGSRNPNDLSRIPELDIPGGTNAVNDLMVDPRAAFVPGYAAKEKVGRRLPRAAANIRQDYFGWDKAAESQYVSLRKAFNKGNLPELIPDPTGAMVPNPMYQQYQQMAAIDRQTRTLAKMRSSQVVKDFDEFLGPTAKGSDIRAIGPPLLQDIQDATTRPFAGNPLGEMLQYRKADTRSNLAAGAFSDLLSPHLSRSADGGVDLMTVLDQGTYGNNNMKRKMLAQAQAAGLLPNSAKIADLKNIFVPADIAGDAMRFGQVFGMPRELNPIIKAFDSLTNLTKASQTTFVPLTFPTLMRNALTELYTNFIGGARNPNAGGIMGYLRPLLDTHGLRSGGNIEGLTHLPMFKGMNDAEATKKLVEMALQYDIRQPVDKWAQRELVGRGAHTSEVPAGLLAPISGKQKGMMESLKGAWPQSLEEAKPWNMRGVGDTMETTFAPVKAGQELMHSVDDMGKMSAFIAYLQQGFDPAVAAAKAKAMRLDASQLAPFEREVMKRLIPFYTWMRTAVPGMAGQLMEQPGGIVGRTIRGSNELRQQEGLIPDYVGEGTAIPIGSRSPEGVQRYLSGLGLPYEELNKFASGGPRPVQRTMQSMLGNLNPVFKVPIEYATGMQLYSGRHLDDLYQRIPGAGVGINQLVENSPFGTVERALSRVADPRKGITGNLMGLFSPARITDADMNKAAMQQGRRLLEEQLRADPNIQSFERLYVPQAMQGQLTPDEMLMLRYYQTLMERARQARLQQAGNLPVPR